MLSLLLLPLLSPLHDHAPQDARAGDTSIGDPYYASMGNGGYDVQHYDLALEVAMPEKSLEARAELRAIALHGLSSFSLDLFGLEVLSVTVDGEPAGFTREGLELVVTPRQPLAQGAALGAAVLTVMQIASGEVPFIYFQF